MQAPGIVSLGSSEYPVSPILFLQNETLAVVGLWHFFFFKPVSGDWEGAGSW